MEKDALTPNQPQEDPASYRAEMERLLAEAEAAQASQATPAPAAPNTAPKEEEDAAAHRAEMERILIELQQEGAPAAPSDDNAPPGTWTWANIKKNLKEVPGQLVRGAGEGVNAAVSGTEKMASWLNENVVDLGTIEFGGENGLVSWRPGMPTSTGKPVIPDSVLPEKPETGLGQITNDAAQLVVGLVGAGKVLKIAEGASMGAAIAGRTLQGAIADFSVFDGNDENISNFIQKHPRYANAVTEFLATKPGDNEAVNRLKRAVEGGIIGAGLEGLIASAKVARAWSKGDKKAAREALDEIDAAAEAQAAAEKAAKEAPATPVVPKEGEQLDMFGQPAKAAEETPVAAPAPAPKEGEQLALSLGDEPLPAAPGAKVEPIPGNGTKGADKPVGTPEVKKIVTVDDENFKVFLADRDWNKGLFQGEGQAVTTLNTQLIDNVDEVGPTINAIASAYEKEIKLARGGGEDGVVTWKEVTQAAKQIGDLTGGKPQMILNQLAQVHKNSEAMAAQMKAFADFHASVAKKVDDLATYVADDFGPIPPGYSSVNEVMADFAKHTELLANVQAMYGGAKTNLARTFNAFKLGGQARDKMLAGMDPDQLFAGGPAAMRAYARRIKGAGGSPKAIGKLVERGFLSNLMKFGQQIWINGILSNPITHAANMAGSAMHLAYLPAEKMLAGALHAGTKEGRAQFVEGALQYRNIVADFKDALKLSVNAFKREGPVLDPGVAGMASEHGSMGLAEFMKNPNGTAEWVFNTFSKATNLSSRMMIAEDEFFKQLAYRSRVRARAGKEWHMGDVAGRQGLSLEEYTTRALDASVDPRTGMGLDKVALEDANRVTFSNNLKTDTYWGSKSYGQIAQTMVNDHPSLRFIMPFVRTPTNIGRFMWSRTPLINLARKEELMNAMGRNGSQAQAEWAARSASGALLWGTAGSLALDGTITGAGPSDPEQRKLLQATGWMPYSVRVNQPDGSVKYVSYAKMDPFGLILGMAADLAEASGHLGDEDLETIASHMGIALAQNLKSKSYLAGLSNFLNAVGDPDRNMAKWMRGQVGSWVPSSLKAFNDDPYMREARTVIDEVKRRIPGYSKDVDPVRNVFGEKVLTPPGWGPDSISPFLTGVQPHLIGDQPVTKDWQKSPQFDVADELARQAYIHGAKLYSPPKDLDGVDLTEFKGTTHSALDRYRELIAQPKPGMPSLRQALQKLVVSPQYQTKMTDGEPGEDGVSGTRQMMIMRVIGNYRQMAKVMLFRENPAILQAVKDAKKREALARRAAPSKQSNPASAAPAN